MTVRRRGLPTKIGGLIYRPMVEVTKSVRDDDGIDHEVLYRSRLGDGRYTYSVRCGYRLSSTRRRWKEELPNCLTCIATPLEALT